MLPLRLSCLVIVSSVQAWSSRAIWFYSHLSVGIKRMCEHIPHIFYLRIPFRFESKQKIVSLSAHAIHNFVLTFRYFRNGNMATESHRQKINHKRLNERLKMTKRRRKRPTKKLVIIVIITNWCVVFSRKILSPEMK